MGASELAFVDTEWFGIRPKRHRRSQTAANSAPVVFGIKPNLLCVLPFNSSPIISAVRSVFGKEGFTGEFIWLTWLR